MFNQKDRLTFYEDRDILSIQFTWYTPMAFFFLFFTIFWNTFLVFWYSMAIVGGAPLVFKLFPLIHVAVGLYLGYTTLCKFVNKTYIDIDADALHIRHAPIPWWRGNVQIPTSDLEQLYVKEVTSSNKNGTSYNYTLRAKMMNGKDKELLSITDVGDSEMLEIEEAIEQFMGIPDRPVRGAYGNRSDNNHKRTPRRQRRDFTGSILSTYYFAQIDEVFNMGEEEVRVLSSTQYDWNDGNSDKFLQVERVKGGVQLVYFQQDRAILKAFKARELSLAPFRRYNFQKNHAPNSITFEGLTFQLSTYKIGDKFIKGQPLKVEQWVYLSSNQLTRIRVVNNRGVMKYYKESPLQESYFNSTLDLNNSPKQQANPEVRKNWDDEDFV